MNFSNDVFFMQALGWNKLLIPKEPNYRSAFFLEKGNLLEWFIWTAEFWNKGYVFWAKEMQHVWLKEGKCWQTTVPQPITYQW